MSVSAELRGCFVTGTDTGVGKTVVAAAIVARLRVLGVSVRAVKPLITGLDDPGVGAGDKASAQLGTH